MGNKLRLIFYVLMFYVLVPLSIFWLSHKSLVTIVYSDLKDYLSVLQFVSGMVFTIMGLWIAFIYPNALLKLKDPNKVETGDFSDSLSDTKRLEALVATVIKSALVVAGIMIFHGIKLLVANTALYTSNTLLIKSFGLSYVILLSILTIETIIHVIYSNVLFVSELHSKREKLEEDSDL